MLNERRSARRKVDNTMVYATHILAHMRNYTSAYTAALADPLAVEIAQAELSQAQLDVLGDMQAWIVAHQGTIEDCLIVLEVDMGESVPEA